jgi:hypothetical protein
MAFSPPDAFDNSEWSYVKVFFFMSTSTSIFCYITGIILALLLCQSLNTCARDCDKWRIILDQGGLPTTIYVIFSTGNMTMALGITFGIFPIYGNAAFILCVCFFACALAVNYYNLKYILGNSHVVHGWYAKQFEEYQITIPFQTLHQYAELYTEFKRIVDATHPNGTEAVSVLHDK